MNSQSTAAPKLTCAISIFFLLILLQSKSATAQRRWEVGGEGSLISCFYRVNATPNVFLQRGFPSGLGGAVVRRNFRKGWFAEAAILAGTYTTGVRMRRHEMQSYIGHDEVLMLSLRAGYPLTLNKRLALVPSAGITPVLKTYSGDGNGINGKELHAGETFGYELQFRNRNQNVFVLANMGAAIEWRMLRNVKLGFGLHYYQGLATHTAADIFYEAGSLGQRRGSLLGNGSFLAFTTGLRYVRR